MSGKRKCPLWMEEKIAGSSITHLMSSSQRGVTPVGNPQHLRYMCVYNNTKMFRRSSSRKMAVTKQVRHTNKVSNTNFKSKLALALSTAQNHGTLKKQPERLGDFCLLENILLGKQQQLPITVQLKRFSCTEGNNQQYRENGIATIQAQQAITTLKCIAPDSSEINLPINDGTICVNFLSIDNTAVYKTLGELRAKRKDHNITWFTCTKNFSLNNKTTFNVGQIFSFAPSTLLSSFKRDRNIRGVTVCQYSSSKKYYLPIDSEGDFKKCDKPTITQNCELSEIAKSQNFPYFISLPPKNLPDHLKQHVGIQLLVKEKMESNIVFVSRKIRGSLQIHSFPVYKDLYAKILPNVPCIDKLDENELKLMSKYFEFSAHDKAEYCVKTYNEIGIIRLLEEIFMELNHHKPKEGVYTRLLGNKNVNRESIQKRVIKTYLRNSTINNNNESCTSADRYLQSVDGIPETNDVIQNGKQSCEKKDVIHNKTRELVVEFDDGGYVIIPFSGNSPKISVDKDFMKYQSMDNVAYNYQRNCDDSEVTYSEPLSEDVYDETDKEVYDQMYDLTCDEHVYTYISSEGLESLLPSTKSATKEENSAEERYSAIYDYSHMGHFSLPASLSRSHIKQMSVAEVGDMLKVNLMKHHVAIFQEYNIDGVELEKLAEKDFIEMNLTQFEARKLTCFLDGWRPKEGSAQDRATWLSKLAKDWSVYDVSKYLQHINMNSLQRFVLRHNVDGFLLKQILNDNVMESLTSQHSLVIKQADITRLRNYVLEDEKPRFKYFQ